MSPDIHQERLEAAKQIIQDLKPPKQGAPPAGQLGTLSSLAGYLEMFGSAHYDYFAKYCDFRDPQKAQTEPSRAHILQTILDQIICDLEVIQRARDQRQALSTSDLLSLTDKVAMRALQPAEELLSAQKTAPTTVLTYVQKSPGIRVIPYAKVALIGVPLTCMSVSRDFMAIPHEVGHYLYWHGRSQEHSKGYPKKRIWEQLMDLFKDRPELGRCSAWREEIFADVYGCLVAGPVAALSCQDQQLEYSGIAFMEDDGEHPTPALRPYTYLWALEKMGWSALICAALEQKWNSEWQNRTDYQQGKPEEAFKALGETVKIMVDFLSQAKMVLDAPWSKDSTDWTMLYGDFAGKLKSWPGLQIPKLADENTPPPDSVWKKWVRRRGFFGSDDPPEDFTGVAFEALERLHLADGWVTKAQHKAISPDVRHPIT